MRIASSVARYLLGLIFTVFGLNGFLHFIPMGPMPPLAGRFLGTLMQSHIMTAVFVTEILAGVLLLATRYIPLAVALLAPVIVNIVLFHAFLEPKGLPLAAFVCLLWVVVAYRARAAFIDLFRPITLSHSKTTAIGAESTKMPARI
jgi:hypothetical protein